MKIDCLVIYKTYCPLLGCAASGGGANKYLTLKIDK